MKDKNEIKPESAGERMMLDGMGVGICRLLLSEELPVLWANTEFYRSIGYTEETYQAQFSNLRHYYQRPILKIFICLRTRCFWLLILGRPARRQSAGCLF